MVIKKYGIVLLAIAGCVMFFAFLSDLEIDKTKANSPSITPKKTPITEASQLPDASCRTIADMAGRKVRIPTTITKAIGTSPALNTYIYMISPDKLAAWMTSLPDEGKKFIPLQYHSLPVLEWGKSSYYDAYISVCPDLVFVEYMTEIPIKQIELTQKKFGKIPVVCIENSADAVGYMETIRFVGEVLGIPDMAEKLVGYYNRVLTEVEAKIASFPESERVRVYYAEGNNGLKTDPKGSVHSQLIDICDGTLKHSRGRTSVKMKSLLKWNPDIIITTSEKFLSNAYGDVIWQKISAVQHRKIYLAPCTVFNWFDCPAGINLIVGIPWTAHLFYPDLFSEDWLKEKVKQFYELYYHYNLSDEDLASLLKE